MMDEKNNQDQTAASSADDNLDHEFRKAHRANHIKNQKKKRLINLLNWIMNNPGDALRMAAVTIMAAHLIYLMLYWRI